jgi:hypothetical protein
MDEEMSEDLGIVIDSSGGKVYNAILSPTLSSSSDDDTSIFWESDKVACCFRDYMDQFTSIYGREKVSRMAVCTSSIHPFQQHRMLFSNN